MLFEWYLLCTRCVFIHLRLWSDVWNGRISLTLCTIGCLAYAGHRMIHFLINEFGILPRIELPLKLVTLADSAELQGKSGVLPLCAMHIWDFPSSWEIFWLLLAVQFWGKEKKKTKTNKNQSYVLEFYDCSRYRVSFMSMCVILLVFLWWACLVNYSSSAWLISLQSSSQVNWYCRN